MSTPHQCLYPITTFSFPKSPVPYIIGVFRCCFSFWALSMWDHILSNLIFTSILPSNHNSSTFTTQGLHSCSPHGIFWYQLLIHTHKHLCTQTHKNTYAETRIHKHTHINIYTYTHFLPILNNYGYHSYKRPNNLHQVLWLYIIAFSLIILWDSWLWGPMSLWLLCLLLDSFPPVWLPCPTLIW